LRRALAHNITLNIAQHSFFPPCDFNFQPI
jgi:hypothetical protein